jgi:hypothetical protein
MNKNIQRTLLLLLLGSSSLGFAGPAQGADIRDSIRGMTKRAIETAPRNFSEIRGASQGRRDWGYTTFDVLPAALPADSVSLGSSLKIEHYEPDAARKSGDLWRLSFGVQVPWSRDEFATQIQKFLGPVIPQDFAYKGIADADDTWSHVNNPEEITVEWKGPDNVHVLVFSFVSDGERQMSVMIEHQLPK